MANATEKGSLKKEKNYVASNVKWSLKINEFTNKEKWLFVQEITK